MRENGQEDGREDAHAPLIAGTETTTPPPLSDILEAPRRPQTWNGSLWLLTLTCSASGFLFGYDTGIISSTLISLGTSLSPRPPTTWDKSLIASSTAFCALLASPLAGVLADAQGRRPVIALASVLFVVGAVVQALAPRVWVLVLGRGIVGAAVGMASAVVPLYIAEIAPRRARGRLVTVQSLFITGGQVVAYVVGWAVRGRWRVAVGAGAAPAVLQLVLLWGMAESPRYLVMKGKEDEARRVLLRIGADEDVEDVVHRIGEELAEGVDKGERDWKSSFKDLVGVPGNRRALTIACMLQGLQQLCGFNSLMYFSATIFSLVGFTSPIGTSIIIAGTNFLFTLCAFFFIDYIGRRRILLLSIPGMCLGLALCAVAFVYIHPAGSEHSASLAAPTMHISHAGTLMPYALLASLVLFVSSYALGLGCVPWQQSELFPLSVRSLGSGIATMTNWGSNTVVGITFLPMMDVLGPSFTFGIYAVVCAVGWVSIYNFYPETMGLALEDVGALLAEGWGVRGRKVYSALQDQDQDQDGRGSDEAELDAG